jgi:hypothetical protein
MKIIYNLEQALVLGGRCLDAIKETKKQTLTGHGIKKLPEEVDGPWEMSVSALNNTIKYISGLGHACYMICVTDSKPEVYKIAGYGFPSLYSKAILKTFKRKRIPTNRTYRVMQCILRPIKKVETASEELASFLASLSYTLPNGVYIWTASDAMILKKDKTGPWPTIGDVTLKLDNKFVPLLAYSGHTDFWDIPVPNFDDIQYAVGKSTPPEFVEWETKKPIAVFRGTTTGCGYTTETNMRLKLSTMRSPDLDVGIVKHTVQMKFDPKEGLGTIKSSEFPLVPPMPMSEQATHKYIIHIDGNVAAYRLLGTMMTGSLILKVDGPYTLWIDHLLKPGKHYVPVKADLSDLDEVLEWCKKHDAKCKKIALEGYEFAKNALTKDYIDASFAKVLWAVKTS